MSIDTLLTVLYALYAEWQKDIPNMRAVTAASLEMDGTAFNIALYKLQELELIRGAVFIRPDQSNYPVHVVMDKITMTKAGIEKTERELQLAEARTGREKLQKLKDKAAVFGWDVLANAAAAIIEQMAAK